MSRASVASLALFFWRKAFVSVMAQCLFAPVRILAFWAGTMFICASGGAVYSVLGIKGRLDPLCTQSVVDFGYKELLYEC